MRIGQLVNFLLGALLPCFLLLARLALAEPFAVDLTHPMPTFLGTEADPTRADLARPHRSSEPIPSFGAQTSYQIAPYFETGQGHFYAGQVIWSEHHGTHLDTPSHYRNDKQTLESDKPDTRTIDQLSVDDLVGPVVFIDISARVQAELAKNAGKPSPDTQVTDFSNSSAGVVTAGDLDAIRDQLRNRSWIVVRSGWSRFYSGTSFENSPYINGWNHPGFNKRACDRLIEIENERGIRVNGIAMDNIAIDSGENSNGKGEFRHGFHCHVRGLQRGWKLAENLTNLDSLARARPGSCTLVVGAPKHIAGSGGPARVIALCER